MTTSNQRMSNKHEAEVAYAFGGDLTPMSGAGWIKKGDIHTDEELIECKATEKRSYSVSFKMLKDLQHEAIVASRIPVLDIKFQPPGERPRRYVVIPEEDYLELRDRAWEMR